MLKLQNFLITHFPHLTFIFMNFVLIISYFVIPQEMFVNFISSTNKYFSFNALIFQAVCMLVFILPLFINKNFFELKKFHVKDSSYDWALLFSTIASIIGYIFFYRYLLQNPEVLVYSLSEGTVSFMKSEMTDNLMPGISTMTQFGVPATIIGLIRYFNSKKIIYLFPVIAIIFLSLFRSFVFSERLAILEIIIPIFFLYIIFERRNLKKLILAFGFLFLIIWSFELIRSYSDPYNNQYNPIYYLSVRLLSYFASSYNNFMFGVENYVIQIYAIDLIKPFLQFTTNELLNFSYRLDLLERFGTVEFNTYTFLGYLYFNFGMFTPIIVFIYSLLLRCIYHDYLKKQFIGLYLFPIFIVGILDIRIEYLLNPRTYFPYFVFLILLFYSYIFTSNNPKVNNG